MYYNPPQLLTNYVEEFQLFDVYTGRLETSVDPDQLVSEMPADLNRHCFSNRIYKLQQWLNQFVFMLYIPVSNFSVISVPSNPSVQSLKLYQLSHCTLPVK